MKRSYYVTFIFGTAIDAMEVLTDFEVRTAKNVMQLAQGIHGTLQRAGRVPTIRANGMPPIRVIILSWVEMELENAIIVQPDGGRQ